MHIQKLPIVRAIINVLDDEENLLAGLLFALAGFVAQWQAINSDSRLTLMVGLVASGLMVIAGFNPIGIAAYFGKKYSHEAGQLAGEAINLGEKLSGLDIDDQVETAIRLFLENKLKELRVDPKIDAQLQSTINRLEALLSGSNISNFPPANPAA